MCKRAFRSRVYRKGKWHNLSYASRSLAICIWLIASEHNDPMSGLFDDDISELSFRARMPENDVKKCVKELLDQGFIEKENAVDSGMLADCYQVATPETETEAETEAETDKGVSFQIDDAINSYNAIAKENGLTIMQRLTKDRRSKLIRRLSDAGGIEGFKIALDKMICSDFCMGNNDRGWKASFDFLMQEQSFTRLMEGFYDNGKNTHGSRKTQQTRESIRNWVES